MNLQGISCSDQLSVSNTLPNQRRHCYICLNRQREKTPTWEHDYLLLRKIVKVTAIGIACLGALYLLKTVCKAAYDEGIEVGILRGRHGMKNEILDRIPKCLDYQTKENVIKCMYTQIGWIGTVEI